MITSFTLDPRYGYKMAMWWHNFFNKRRLKWEKKVKELEATEIKVMDIIVPTKKCLVILFKANGTDTQLVMHGEDHKYDKQYWSSLQVKAAVEKTDILSNEELKDLLMHNRNKWETI